MNKIVCPHCWMYDNHEYTDPELKDNKVYRYFICKNCNTYFVAIGKIENWKIFKTVDEVRNDI